MSHKQSAAKATPVRTTKLAYVESVTKNPRGQVNIIFDYFILSIQLVTCISFSHRRNKERLLFW